MVAVGSLGRQAFQPDKRYSRKPRGRNRSAEPKYHPPPAAARAVSKDFGLVVLDLREQTELRRIARGLDEAQVPEGVRSHQPAARGALDEALLNQERLDDLLDRITRLRQRR